MKTFTISALVAFACLTGCHNKDAEVPVVTAPAAAPAPGPLNEPAKVTETKAVDSSTKSSNEVTSTHHRKHSRTGYLAHHKARHVTSSSRYHRSTTETDRGQAVTQPPLSTRKIANENDTVTATGDTTPSKDADYVVNTKSKSACVRTQNEMLPAYWDRCPGNNIESASNGPIYYNAPFVTAEQVMPGEIGYGPVDSYQYEVAVKNRRKHP